MSPLVNSPNSSGDYMDAQLEGISKPVIITIVVLLTLKH